MTAMWQSSIDVTAEWESLVMITFGLHSYVSMMTYGHSFGTHERKYKNVY